MKSSDEMMAVEHTTETEAGLSTAEVREMMPATSAGSYWLKRIDIPVQLGRIGLFALIFWLWKSDTIWDGWDAFSIFGVEPFPNVPPTFRATPNDAWEYLTEIYHERLFWVDAWVTLKEAIIIFFVGSTLGLIAGLTLGRFHRIAKVFGPFIVLFNAMPKIAFLPLILVIYGVGEMSKVVLGVMIVFFIVQVPTQAAVGLVDPDLDMVARTMGASQMQRFLKVTLPGITPAVFGAMRLAAVVGVQAAVFGEIFAAKRGLGQRLITAANQLQYGKLFALVFVLALVALVMNGIIGALERYALRWQATQQSTQVVSF